MHGNGLEGGDIFRGELFQSDAGEEEEGRVDGALIDHISKQSVFLTVSVRPTRSGE